MHTPALNHFFPPRLTVATSECGENIFDEMQGTPCSVEIVLYIIVVYRTKTISNNKMCVARGRGRARGGCAGENAVQERKERD